MIAGGQRRRRYVTADQIEAYIFDHPGKQVVMTRTEATVRVGGLELVAPLPAVEADGGAA